MRMAGAPAAWRGAIGCTLLGPLLLVWAGMTMAADHGSPLGQAPSARASSAAAAASAPARLVDINSASRKQLKALPGIGDAEADRIIAARPYLSKTHLVSDAGIPAGIYQSIRHRIIAVQNKAARAKLAALAKAGRPAASASQPR